MLRYIFPIILGTLATAAIAQEQQISKAGPTQSSSVTENVVRPGDRWIYETLDEISSNIVSTRTTIVTEVSPTGVAVRVTDPTKPGAMLILFDNSWNVISNGNWKYSPHDGTGIEAPLEVGKTWSLRSNEISSANGQSWKRSGKSKVTSRETLTTKAGSFDTFKIETSYQLQNAADPTHKTDVVIQTWYAPSVNHWIRRKLQARANKHLLSNTTTDLIEYGRK